MLPTEHFFKTTSISCLCSRSLTVTVIYHSVRCSSSRPTAVGYITLLLLSLHFPKGGTHRQTFQTFSID